MPLIKSMEINEQWEVRRRLKSYVTSQLLKMIKIQVILVKLSQYLTHIKMQIESRSNGAPTVLGLGSAKQLFHLFSYLNKARSM